MCTEARLSRLAIGLALAGALLAAPSLTRFTVEFSEAVPYKLYTMRDPYRVVLDLPEVAWRVPAAAARAHGGLIDGFRYGRFKPGTFRIVLDVGHPVTVRGAFAAARAGRPSHLVLELATVTRSEFDRLYTGPPPPTPAAIHPVPPPIPPDKMPRRADGRHVVVIDPGHGGVDPGATGVSGIYEKDITLAAARELKRQLEASGRYHVVLTRNSDVFLPLRERVQLGRAAHGELFISLHADSLGSREVSGSTVYTLSEKASDAEAAALAADENKADIIAGANLSDYPEEVADILVDLAQRETKNDSIKYAHELVQQLEQSGWSSNHGVRSAGFAVLKAPDVPSVLLEMGYLSNAREERELRDSRYRAKLMGAVKRAIDLYFAALDRMTKS
jgi:N-acetylmuramoyl-L-alanine amidase